MKKIHLLILPLLILLLPFTGNSQKSSRGPAKVTWGKETKEPPKSRISYIIGTHSDGFYALRLAMGGYFKASTLIIEDYNNQNNLVKGTKVDLTYEKKDRFFEGTLLYNGNFLLFSSFYNKNKDLNYLFMETIDKKTLNSNGKPKVLATIKAEKRWNNGGFNHLVSRDSSKLMVFYDLPYERKEREKFGVKVFDENVNQLWEKEIELPYEDELFSITNYKVDNEGNVYVLGRLFKDKVKERKKGKPNFRYVILSYKNNGETFKEYKLNLGDDFITDLTFQIADNGDFICAGFYSEDGTRSIKGTLFFHIDGETNMVTNKKKKEFKPDFLEKFMSDRKASNGGELYQFDLDELILRSDGGVVLIAEQFYIVTHTTRDQNGNMRTSYTYHYKDIIVVNIDPSGNIEWASKIPKRQITRNDGGYFSSYVLAIVKDKMYFIFNDNIKNLQEKDPKRLANFSGGKNGIVTMAVLDSKGEYDKYPLISTKEEGVMLRPKVCEQSGRKEMIIYGERGKKYKFGKVTFD